jgi:hypothetical protein
MLAIYFQLNFFQKVTKNHLVMKTVGKTADGVLLAQQYTTTACHTALFATYWSRR